MFFSVIIPTYNPKRFLPELLDNITFNDCIDDIEIIISDDLSTEPFEDILKDYDYLNIRIIYNKEHKGFPRDGRQHGIDEAQGDWITFIDQDDLFVKNAFDKVKKCIIDNHIENYLVSDFIFKTLKNTEEIWGGQSAWTHGKFIKRNFIKKYNIYYDQLDYCEDIDFTTKIDCILKEHKLTYYYAKDPVYIWRAREDSLSQGEYFIKGFSDYIKSSLQILMNYIEKYRHDTELRNVYKDVFLSTFVQMYFYLQSAAFMNNNKKIMLDCILLLRPIYTHFKEIFNYTNSDILSIIMTDLLIEYNNVRNVSSNQVPFIEQLTFSQWLMAYFD